MNLAPPAGLPCDHPTTDDRRTAMGALVLDISMSVDGFVAGPDQTLEEPIGRGGERLHEWAFGALRWRETHGLDGGEANVDSDVIDEHLAQVGATVMGRRMFSGGEGPWEQDPNADAWWGEEPPFHHPVFVLTHHARAPLVKEGGTTFTFVTAGIEAALDQARAAAGARDVHVAGGAQAAQQYLAAGLLDEVQLHVAPVLLGAGERLFEDGLAGAPRSLERSRVIASPTGVTHLRYRVVR
jgi:dihydrofolate reductase